MCNGCAETAADVKVIPRSGGKNVTTQKQDQYIVSTSLRKHLKNGEGMFNKHQ